MNLKLALTKLTKLELSSIITSYLSVLLGFLSLYLVLKPSLEENTIAKYFIIQNIVIIITLILLSGYFIRLAELRYKKIQEWDSNRYEIPKIIHNFIHEMRNYLSNECTSICTLDQSYLQLQMACNCCKSIFDKITKIDTFDNKVISVENVVTIKMICDNGESFVTVARDQAGMNIRKKGQKHKIKENTEFMHLAMKDPVKSRHYINNALHFTDNYSNTNSYWKSQYTSTLIVPIRKDDILVGCLSVDCKIDQNDLTTGFKNRKISDVYNIYNEKNHVELLAIFADLLYCLIEKTMLNNSKA